MNAEFTEELTTHPTAEDDLVVEGYHLSDGLWADAALASVADVDRLASKTVSSASSNDRQERRSYNTRLQPPVSLQKERSEQTLAQQRAPTGSERATIRARNDMMRANLQARQSVRHVAHDPTKRKSKRRRSSTRGIQRVEGWMGSILGSLGACLNKGTGHAALLCCGSPALRSLPAISSTNAHVMTWHCFMSLVMVVVAVFVPFDTAFFEPGFTTKTERTVFGMNRMLDIVFLMDMILQFNLCVPDPESPGAILSDRVKIAHVYFKGWFLMDFIALIPFDIISQLFEDYGLANLSAFKIVKVLRLLRITKLLRLLKTNRLFLYIETHYEIDYGDVSLAKFVLMLVFLCHWLACAWYMVIDLEKNQVCMLHEVYGCCYNWLDCVENKLVDLNERGPFQREYMLSMVWAGGEVFIVSSYIEAVTTGESVMKLFAQTLCGIVYAYLLGALCNIFAQKTRLNTKFYESMDQLNTYLRENGVNTANKELCVSLRTFFRYSFSRGESMLDVLDNLTPVFQAKLAYQVHSRWVRCLFPGLVAADGFNNLSASFFYAVALKLELQLFAPLEPLTDVHDLATNVFIIQSGVVMTRGLQLRHCGDLVGDDALAVFRHDTKRGYQATSLTHGRVYSLVVADLLEIMMRPQHSSFLDTAFKRIRLLIAANMIQYFGRAVRRAVADSRGHTSSFLYACKVMAEELHFVDEKALPGCLGIMTQYLLQVTEGRMRRSVGEVREVLARIPGTPQGLLEIILDAIESMQTRTVQYAHQLQRHIQMMRANTFASHLTARSRDEEESTGYDEPEYIHDQERSYNGTRAALGPVDRFKAHMRLAKLSEKFSASNLVAAALINDSRTHSDTTESNQDQALHSRLDQTSINNHAEPSQEDDMQAQRISAETNNKEVLSMMTNSGNQLESEMKQAREEMQIIRANLSQVISRLDALGSDITKIFQTDAAYRKQNAS